MKAIATTIEAYNTVQANDEQAICIALQHTINKCIPSAESKIWHGHPVWFINGNPVAGYSKRKAGISLMFWSGQSFDEPELKAVGSFKAAEIIYTNVQQIDTSNLGQWLQKAQHIQWDYKNIVKRKGRLERL